MTYKRNRCNNRCRRSEWGEGVWRL